MARARRQTVSRATMGNHVVNVQRRSGDTFTPIGSGAAVKPGEAIRYYVRGVISSFYTSFGHATFRVKNDATGEIVFEASAGIGINNDGWLDVAAPYDLGTYTVSVEGQDFSAFIGGAHVASTTFRVSNDAPPPPTEPPGGGNWFGQLNDFLQLGVVFVGGLVVYNVTRKL